MSESTQTLLQERWLWVSGTLLPLQASMTALCQCTTEWINSLYVNVSECLAWILLSQTHLDVLSVQRTVADTSMRQGIELLSTALQSVPVLQVQVVAFRDPLSTVEETPTAAGDHCSAVTVTWGWERRRQIVRKQSWEKFNTSVLLFGIINGSVWAVEKH